MTVYVDWMMDNGWRLGKNCHMFTDNLKDLTELHAMANKVGMKWSWFQNKPNQMPHYDLVESRRNMAVKLGAVEINTRDEWRKIAKPISDYWKTQWRLM